MGILLYCLLVIKILLLIEQSIRREISKLGKNVYALGKIGSYACYQFLYNLSI